MRTPILIAILVAFSLHVHAKKIPGIIVKGDESIHVNFEIKVSFIAGEPNFERIQYKVKYYNDAGKKVTLRPEDTDEILFYFGGVEVRMISCENTLSSGNIFITSKRIFLKIEIDGPLRLYRFYYSQMSPGVGGAPGGAFPNNTSTYHTVNDFIFQKGNGELKSPRTLGWRKDMIEYFSDCPALRERIESKDLRRKEVEEIVKYYNIYCGKR